jgi:hypothetical protein
MLQKLVTWMSASNYWHLVCSSFIKVLLTQLRSKEVGSNPNSVSMCVSTTVRFFSELAR